MVVRAGSGRTLVPVSFGLKSAMLKYPRSCEVQHKLGWMESVVPLLFPRKYRFASFEEFLF